MNTRDFAKYVLDGCLEELNRLASYVDTDMRIDSIAFRMHTLAYDYIMKGAY